MRASLNETIRHHRPKGAARPDRMDGTLYNNNVTESNELKQIC
jgi:hypothetical protein